MHWLIDVTWMTIAASHIYRTVAPAHLWRTMPIWHAPTHQRTCPLIPVLDHQDPFQPFHNDTFGYCYIWLYQLLSQHHLIQHLDYIMNATNYWVLAREYSVWNAAVATLQFWTPDLEPDTLSSTIQQVYVAFFYTTSMHLLCNQPEEVIFSYFMTTLNDAFERELTLANEGYESGSETSNLPTSLRLTSRMHHVSSDENISFDPSIPCTTATSQSNCKPVCHHLSFSSSYDEDISAVHNSTSLPLKPMGFAKVTSQYIYTMGDDFEEEEDFQTVALNDEHWITEPVPDRHLCIHKHSQPHSLCCYKCLYGPDSASVSYPDILDLSDISDFKDVMTTSSDEDYSLHKKTFISPLHSTCTYLIPLLLNCTACI